MRAGYMTIESCAKSVITLRELANKNKDNKEASDTFTKQSKHAERLIRHRANLIIERMRIGYLYKTIKTRRPAGDK